LLCWLLLLNQNQLLYPISNTLETFLGTSETISTEISRRKAFVHQYLVSPVDKSGHQWSVGQLKLRR
jgi:hypothetical protein